MFIHSVCFVWNGLPNPLQWRSELERAGRKFEFDALHLVFVLCSGVFDFSPGGVELRLAQVHHGDGTELKARFCKV